MDSQVKLIKPYISFHDVAEELEGIFDSGQLTKGPHVAKLINTLRSYCNSKYAFMTTSATTALTMCLKAIDLKPGDKVAVSDFSFPATANVVEDLGATPVFIDVDRRTFNMSADDLRARYSPSVKAVIYVDALGNPSGLTDVKALTDSWGIPLIEDAACAIGSSVNGSKVGSIADLTCFSFHPRKLLTTGEGGAILTNDGGYADWFDVKLNHGASGFKGKGLDFVDFGYNFRMSEIQALMGWKQIEKLGDIVTSRNKIADECSVALRDLGFARQHVHDNVIHNIQSLAFTVPNSIDRDDLIDYLATRGIESTIGTYCLSGATYFKRKYENIRANAHWLESNTITLPCYDGVDVGRVTSAIRDFVSAQP